MKQRYFELALIPHQVGEDLVHQRAIDGYVNATAMCKACKKVFADYRRLRPTEDFLSELSAVMGIPITELVITIQGGQPDLQGTWVHPNVAMNLGQWCSPKFAVAVAQWVHDWITGNIKPVGLPYHIQRYIANRQAIPTTHFSMLNEMIFALIAPLESAGYTLPENMVPDISMGRMFCKWLREEKGIDTDDLPTYAHQYDDGRVVNAKLYPNEVLADLRNYFHNEWMPRKAESYFAQRDPKALEFVQKLLLLPDESKVSSYKAAQGFDALKKKLAKIPEPIPNAHKIRPISR